MATKKTVKKTVRATVKKTADKVKKTVRKAFPCDACDGAGLFDRNTLCPKCGGSGIDI